MDVHVTIHVLAIAINLVVLATVIIGHVTASVIITINAFVIIRVLVTAIIHVHVTVTIALVTAIKRRVAVTRKDKRYYQ